MTPLYHETVEAAAYFDNHTHFSSSAGQHTYYLMGRTNNELDTCRFRYVTATGIFVSN